MRELGQETTVTLGALYYLYTVNGGAAYDFGELEAGIAHGCLPRRYFLPRPTTDESTAGVIQRSTGR